MQADIRWGVRRHRLASVRHPCRGRIRHRARRLFTARWCEARARLPGDAPAGRIVCGRRLCDDTSVLTLPYLPAYSIIMIALHKVAAPRLDRTAKAADEVAAYERIDSTHAKARRLIERGRFARNDDGGIAITVVAAGAMDDARGRLGRPWACVPGHSFAISFIVTIPESVATDDAVNGWMSMIAGLATLDAIEGTLDECGAVPFDPECGFHLKWPNDIYWKDKKICGILIENDLSGHHIRRSIAGIGININQEVFNSDAPNPVSLKQITGKEHDRYEILAHILRRVQIYYNSLQMEDFAVYSDEISTRYARSLFRRRGLHPYEDANGKFLARLLRVEQDGRFVLEDEGGSEREYLFKEVQYIL